MKFFFMGCVVGFAVCVACCIAYTAAMVEINRNQEKNEYLDRLYFSEPREGNMAEWLYLVEELPPAERILLCEQLERSAETFLIAYIGVSVTNQDMFVSLMDRYIPIKKLVGEIAGE